MKRKKQVKIIKKDIENDVYDGIFTSDHLIENNGFVDLFFIGEYGGKEVVWNTTLTTAKGDYYNKIQGMALDAALKKFPNPEGYNFMDCFVECEDKPKFKKYVDPTPELSSKRYRYMSELEMELINSGNIKIQPHMIEIDEDYEFGIGLHVRLNIDSINVYDVKKFVKRFQRMGINSFNGLDNSGISWNSTELGVELNDDETFIRWNSTYPNDVELDPNKVPPIIKERLNDIDDGDTS